MQIQSLNGMRRDCASLDSSHDGLSSSGPCNGIEASQHSSGGNPEGKSLQDTANGCSAGSCGEGREAGEDATGCLGLEGTGSPSKSKPTDVVVHVLDWKDSVEHLQPPFRVLLVADVVSICFLSLCTRPSRSSYGLDLTSWP